MRRDGFTCIEVLIAITLFAILFAILTALFIPQLISASYEADYIHLIRGRKLSPADKRSLYRKLDADPGFRAKVEERWGVLPRYRSETPVKEYPLEEPIIEGKESVVRKDPFEEPFDFEKGFRVEYRRESFGIVCVLVRCSDGTVIHKSRQREDVERVLDLLREFYELGRASRE